MGASLANAGYSQSAVTPTRSRIGHCKRKFLRFFPEGFRDETYFDWERGYKLRAHEEWQSVLNRTAYQSKLSHGKFFEIGVEAVKIESRTNLLFSFEKMAIRDALSPNAARGPSLKASMLFCTAQEPCRLSSFAGVKLSRACHVNRAAYSLGPWLPCSDSSLNLTPISS